MSTRSSTTPKFLLTFYSLFLHVPFLASIATECVCECREVHGGASPVACIPGVYGTRTSSSASSTNNSGIDVEDMVVHELLSAALCSFGACCRNIAHSALDF